MIVTIKQISFLWSYFSPLNQAEKGCVFCSVYKHFETGGNLRNFYDKQILKMWTPCFALNGVIYLA